MGCTKRLALPQGGSNAIVGCMREVAAADLCYLFNLVHVSISPGSPATATQWV